MRYLLTLILLVAVGCSSAQVDEATLTAAEHNVTAWRSTKEYVVLWGRADTPEAEAANAKELKRLARFITQAEAIVAGLKHDKSFNAREALKRNEEIDLP